MKLILEILVFSKTCEPA